MIVAELDCGEKIASGRRGMCSECTAWRVYWLDPRNQTIKEKQPVGIDAINWEEIWELVLKKNK